MSRELTLIQNVEANEMPSYKLAPSVSSTEILSYLTDLWVVVSWTQDKCVLRG